MSAAALGGQIAVTPRTALKGCSGVGLHLAWAGTPYAGPDVAQHVLDLGVGLVRDRWMPDNRHQQDQLGLMGAGGVGLCLFVYAQDTAVDDVAPLVAELGQSDVALYLRALLGGNEPNGRGGDTWPSKLAELQQALWDAAAVHLPDAGVVSPALMWNVGNPPGEQKYDDDWAAMLDACGSPLPWHQADHHFYPGKAGPAALPAENARIRSKLTDPTLWQSETGWTQADTDEGQIAVWVVEALLRNFLDGIIGTVLYELYDDPPEGQHSGHFGLVMADGTPKASYVALQGLLATSDGGEATPDPFRLSRLDDAQAVATSEGSGCFTVYLLRNDNSAATLVLPPSCQADVGVYELGQAGNRRYSIELAESMVEVHVSPA